MASTIHPNRRATVLASMYLAGVSLALFALFQHWSYDDPFITYRYAKNLEHGLGFVYNPGERVLSTTTPLFVLLLGLLGSVWRDLPQLANLVGAVSLSLGGLCAWNLAREWGSPSAAWVGLLLYPSFPLLLNTLGSETSLYLALCLGAFLFYARHRYTLTALVAGLAVLARPDGALVALILGVDYLMHVRRPIPQLSVGLFLGITLGWSLFAWAYFGSPIPATLVAKRGQGSMSISTPFAIGLLDIVQWYAKWPYILELLLATLGVWFLAWRARQWVPFVVWPFLYFLAYTSIGVSQYFWYYAPLVPGFLALVGLGIDALLEIGSSSIPRRLRAWNNIDSQVRVLSLGRGLLAVALVGSLLTFQALDLWQLRRYPDQRIRIYTAVGEWLRENTPSDALIGVLEAGIIGYYAERPIIDFAGLARPQVAGLMSATTSYEDVAIWTVEKYKPKYLVLQEGAFPRLEQGYVVSACLSVQRFDGHTYGYRATLWIYRCSPDPESY